MGACTKACAATEFALSQTCREVRRTKCTYCLGVSSVLLVVLLAGVAQSLLEKAPLIFLRQAENSSGQLDIEMTALASIDQMFLNYTAISERVNVLANSDDFRYHAPRYVLRSPAYKNSTCTPRKSASSTAGDNAWMYHISETQMCDQSCLVYLCEEATLSTVVVIDTEAERAMGLGREWTYPAVPEGGAYMHEGLARQMGVTTGDTIIVDLMVPFTIAFAFASPGSEQAGWNDASRKHNTISLPVKVTRILPDNAVSEWLLRLAPPTSHCCVLPRCLTGKIL